jgi:hypothetical protein
MKILSQRPSAGAGVRDDSATRINARPGERDDGCGTMAS